MHLFDRKQRMRKYNNVESIIDSFYPIRLAAYVKRKKYMIKQLEKTVKILHNKARFIEEQCDDTIDLRRKKKDVVFQLLSDRTYNKVNGDFKYLTSMPIHSVIEENIELLRKERDEKKLLLETLKNKSVEDMWEEELDEFLIEYKKYKKYRKKQ